MINRRTFTLFSMCTAVGVSRSEERRVGKECRL